MVKECDPMTRADCEASNQGGCGSLWRHSDESLWNASQGTRNPPCALHNIKQEMEWREATNNRIPNYVVQLGPRKPRPWDDNPIT